MVETLISRPYEGDLIRAHPVLDSSFQSQVISDPVVERSDSRDKKGEVTVQTGFVFGCISTLFDILHCYGLSKPTNRSPVGRRVQRSIERSTAYWLKASDALGDGGWMKFAKYKLAAFFHSHTEQLDTPPPCPLPPTFIDKPDKLLKGVAGRWLATLLRSSSPIERMGVLNSILLAKKGMPRPDDKMIKKAVEATRIALTTKKDLDTRIYDLSETKWGSGDGDFHPKVIYHLSRFMMEQQLKRTVDEIFGKLKLKASEIYYPRFPSTSAAYDHSRSEGGHLRAIAMFIKKNMSYEESSASKVRFTKSKPAQEERHGFVATFSHGGSVRSDVTGTGRTTPRPKPDFDEIDELRRGKGDQPVEAYPHFFCDASGLERGYQVLYDRMLAAAMREVPRVEPVGLAEPLKVRVITKGPPLTSFVLKPLQKFMWKAVAETNWGRLVGTPVTSQIVQDAMGARLLPGEAYLSGDYSAATDNLAPWVSEYIAKCIGEALDLPIELRVLFARALTRHRLSTITGEVVSQEWGQLMGSIISFPVLCIANAAMCRWALEIGDNRPYQLQQAKMLINGDDCLLRTNMRGLDAWKKITSFGGLTPSLGKYYFSTTFANINSTNFVHLPEGGGLEVWHEKVRMAHFVQTPYLNMGLLYGMKRSAEKVDISDAVDSYSSIGTRARELMNTCPPNIRESVWKLFKHHHWDIISEARVPWFVPEKFGGLGLPLIQIGTQIEPQGDNENIEEYTTRTLFAPDAVYLNEVSKEDLRCLARILERPDEYKVGPIPMEVPWQTWKVAQTLLPAQPVSVQKPDEEDKDKMNRLMSLLVVDTLFRIELRQETVQNTARVKPSLLLSEERLQDARKSKLGVLARNRRTWKKVLHAGKLPPPISISRMLTVEPATPLLGITFL